jgi:hypothetical protein
MDQLVHDFEEEKARIQERVSADTVELEPTEVKPKKTDVAVKKVELVWMPTRARS